MRTQAVLLPSNWTENAENIPVNVNIDDAAVLKEAEMAAPGALREEKKYRVERRRSGCISSHTNNQRQAPSGRRAWRPRCTRPW